MGEINSYKILVKKPEGKRGLDAVVDGIDTDVREMEFQDVN
jgi:hypothetical protein